MKINVIGGGPAGLYFSLLTKRRLPAAEIDVFEQNPLDATYGFGIVLADSGLSRLAAADPQSFKMIEAAMFVTRHQIIMHRETPIFVERKGFGGALARLRLLNILQDCAQAAGVRVHYGRRIEPGMYEADLVVGADGVNSVVRQGHEAQFGTTAFDLTSWVAWYGTKRHFPYPMLCFRQTELGHFVAAAYPYTESMSTFVAECDDATYRRAGIARMNIEARQSLVERVFAPELGGEKLLNNNSNFRHLAVVRNKTWFSGNRVLVGDALHSAHPTIGSGTRIAMEDAIVLADCVAGHARDISAGLAAFQRLREPSKQKLLDATERSYTWYERFADKMDTLAPVDFVFDFMMRTGRITDARLAAEFPEFVRRYGDCRHAA